MRGHISISAISGIQATKFCSDHDLLAYDNYLTDDYTIIYGVDT